MLPEAIWSVRPIRPSDQSDAIVAGFLYMFLFIYTSHRVPTSFPTMVYFSQKCSRSQRDFIHLTFSASAYYFR